MDTAIPGHDRLAPMAAGLIHAALAKDSVTMGLIVQEIAKLDIDAADVAVTSAAIAGRMLARASGRAAGTRIADEVARAVAARSAQANG